MVEDRPVPEKRTSAELKVEAKDGGLNPGASPDWAKDGDLMTTRTPEMAKSPARTPGSDSQQKSLEIPKLPLAPEAKVDSGAGSPAEKVQYPVPASILPRRIEADSTKSNVLVLDDYRETDILLEDDKGFSHGELSARLAEENGLNVTRMQVGLLKANNRDIPGALSQIDKGMSDGTIDLKKGDVVNISLGLETSFKDVSNLVGFPVTAENIRDEKEHVLDAMRDNVNSNQFSRNDRAFMRHVLAITDGIEKLQERGLEVVAAGGNKGADSLNIGLLAADKQYSALDPEGKMADYSANNSITEAGRGQIDFSYLPVSMFDKKLFEQQSGQYRVDGTNLYLSSKGFGGDLDGPFLTPDAKRLLSFNGTLDDANATKGTSYKMSPANFASWQTGTNVQSAKGTSFVNVFKLPDEFEK